MRASNFVVYIAIVSLSILTPGNIAGSEVPASKENPNDNQQINPLLLTLIASGGAILGGVLGSYFTGRNMIKIEAIKDNNIIEAEKRERERQLEETK